MGRFESTVPFYARFREPYPRDFFSIVAGRLALSRDMRLLDAGCGPGLLAIGFAPYVGSCTGVDPEPAMLRAAEAAAKAAGVRLELIEGRLEDVPESVGAFHLVTIGRALHWMDREASLRVLERAVAKEGSIITCGTRTAKTEANPWLAPYDEVRKAWAEDQGTRRYEIDENAWFAASAFCVADEIVLPHSHRVTISDLIGRALSKSNTSPQVLGVRREPFERALARVLEPYAVDGFLDEELVAVATVMRRAGIPVP
jgi:SAM-dependent methyltransferase